MSGPVDPIDPVERSRGSVAPGTMTPPGSVPASGSAAEVPAATARPVPQHLCLVLPSTGEFDSRTWRIASAAVARGHTVTVVARAGPGLPAVERDPAGYTTTRIPYAAIDGLPFQPLVLTARNLSRRVFAWRTGTPYPPVGRWTSARDAGAGSGAGDRVSTGAGFPPAPPDEGPAPPSAAPSADEAGRLTRARRSVTSAPRRAGTGVVRRLSILLTIRSQRDAARMAAPRADLYHGMAYMGIPIALDLAGRAGAPAVYDARDIYLEAANLARMGGPMRRFVAEAERRWAHRAARVVTVNRPYAEVMAERWGIPLPLIVMNCSYRQVPPEPLPRRFHEALGLDPGTRVVLYQGGFSRDRGIEQLLDAIAAIPDAVLVLLGYGKLEEELRARAAGSGGRVHVLPAVAPAELLAWVGSADVVAMPIQPTTLNHRLTTPNKLFEAMAAGVPVVASDLPGMAPIVTETGCGRLCDPTDPAAIAAAARAILDAPPAERAAFRARALAAAHATYNWESQVELLFGEYGRLTGKPW